MTDIEKLEQLLEDFKIESTTFKDDSGISVSVYKDEKCETYFDFYTDGSFEDLGVLIW